MWGWWGRWAGRRRREDVKANPDLPPRSSGPDRLLFLPGGLLDPSEVPAYLNGTLAGECALDLGRAGTLVFGGRLTRSSGRSLRAGGPLVHPPHCG